MLGQRISDQDVERLFCGETPNDQALVGLTPILASLQSASLPSPSEVSVARFATKAAELAKKAEPQTAHKPSSRPSGSGWLPVLSRGLATALASILLISGMTAIAIASDDAAPGDTLYGIDRALEAIGIGDGAAVERIAEARALFDRGQVTEAIEHAAEAVAETPVSEDAKDFSPEAAGAAEALKTAADSVQAGDGGESQQVRDAVAAMLTEMAAMIQDPAFQGEDFGQKVAEMARMIGGDDSNGPTGNGEAPGNSGDTPGPAEEGNPGPPENPPGKSDGAPGQSNNAPDPSDGAQTESPDRP